MDSFANNPYFLINIELKHLYYTFKYLLVAKLFNLLNKSSYNITKKVINQIINFYNSYKKHRKLLEHLSLYYKIILTLITLLLLILYILVAY